MDFLDVSPELLLQWARDCVEFLRRIRADPLAFSYIFGLLKRWLSRPVPSYGKSPFEIAIRTSGLY